MHCQCHQNVHDMSSETILAKLLTRHVLASDLSHVTHDYAKISNGGWPHRKPSSQMSELWKMGWTLGWSAQGNMVVSYWGESLVSCSNPPGYETICAVCCVCMSVSVSCNANVYLYVSHNCMCNGIVYVSVCVTWLCPKCYEIHVYMTSCCVTYMLI